jgi:hypothetical protein
MLITEMQTNNATCQKEEKKQFDKKLFSVKKKSAQYSSFSMKHFVIKVNCRF